MVLIMALLGKCTTHQANAENLYEKEEALLNVPNSNPNIDKTTPKKTQPGIKYPQSFRHCFQIAF